MPMTAKEYFTQRLAEAGIPQAEIAQILSRAESHLTSQQVYTSNEYDSMKGRADASSRKIQEYDQWYERTKPTVEQIMKRNAEIEAKLKEYEEGGGTLPSGFDPSKYVSREDLEKSLGDVQGRVGNVMKVGLKLASSHAAKFGEALDIDQLEKIAVERGLPLELAYNEMIRPREEAARAEAHKREIDQKVQEAIAAERAKRPTIEPRESTRPPLFSKQKPAADFSHDKLTEELVQIWETGKDIPSSSAA